MDPSFYGLKQQPFDSPTDPSQVWCRGHLAKLYTSLEESLQSQAGIFVVTGRQGAGKTTLLHYLSASLRGKSVVVNPGLPESDDLEYFNNIAAGLNIKKGTDSKTAFLVHFRNALVSIYEARQNLILLIDEADRLSVYILKELYMLSCIKMAKHPITSIVFAGKPGFAEYLSKLDWDLSHSITQHYEMQPLSKSETANYVRHRVRTAKATRKIFTHGALGHVYQYSQGNPGKTDELCQITLEYGYKLGRKTIDTTIVDKCVHSFRSKKSELHLAPGRFDSHAPASENRDGIEISRRPVFFWLLVWGSLGLFLGSGIYLLFITDIMRSNRWSINEIAPKVSGVLNDQIQEIKEQILSADQKDSPAEKPQPDIEKPVADRLAEDALQSEAPDINASQIEGDQSGGRYMTDLRLDDWFLENKILIYFKMDSNELQQEAYGYLDRIAAFLNSRPELEAVITGYTDSSGPTDYNVTISRIRAESIASYLMAKGVDRNRMHTYGLGPKNPIESNRTEEGRRLNRRVEIELRKNGG